MQSIQESNGYSVASPERSAARYTRQLGFAIQDLTAK
jgi:hypothetical protein